MDTESAAEKLTKVAYLPDHPESFAIDVLSNQRLLDGTLHLGQI